MKFYNDRRAAVQRNRVNSCLALLNSLGCDSARNGVKLENDFVCNVVQSLRLALLRPLPIEQCAAAITNGGHNACPLVATIAKEEHGLFALALQHKNFGRCSEWQIHFPQLGPQNLR